MGRIILQGVTFCMVVVVASCFELYSTNLDLTYRVSKYNCIEEGRFHHPELCGAYIECVRSRAGTFKRRFGSCHGSMFNEQLKKCIEPVEKSDCITKSRRERSITDDQKFEKLCSSIQNGFVCSDCKTAVNCVDGVAYPETCGAGDTCDVRDAFGGAVCYPGEPQYCTCHDKYAFHVDKYNPQMFFYCDQIGAEPDMNQCPDGWRFDDDNDVCTNDEGLPECQQTGRFALHNNCSEYYTCISSRTGWVQKKFNCDDGLMLNEDTGNCEDPCTWNTGEFQCQSEGRYSDPLSCQNYYECVQQGHGFRQYRRECPRGTVWDNSALNGHGHCVEDNTVDCAPVSVNKCHIPEGRCLVAPPPETPPPATPPPATPPPATPPPATLPTVEPEFPGSPQVPPGTPNIPDNLEYDIATLRETKASLEKEIEDETFATTKLLDTATALADLHSTLIQVKRSEMPGVTDFVRVTVDSEGRMMISPYCNSTETSFLMRFGTPEEMLQLILTDLKEFIVQDPEVLPCMNDVITDFNTVLRNDLTIIDNLILAAGSVVETIEFASNMYEEAEMNLIAATEKLTQVSSDLMELETLLASGSFVRSPSGFPIRRFSPSGHRDTPKRIAVRVKQHKIPVQGRWQVMSRGVRRARSLQPTK